MSSLDWVVLTGTLLFIVAYGVLKARGNQNIEGYLKGGYSMKWWTVGLSVMATQASAITFLSTPGLAYEDGMRFVQFYFGLPLALIIVSITFVPIFYRLKVYTAYEYLENRFDLKTRTLAALLFLVQRGMAAGITIYAPSIILSTILGWNLTITTIIIGLTVIIYTVSGGTKAVSQTQKQQMGVMLAGMLIAGLMIVRLLPEGVSFSDALTVAGSMGRMKTVDFSLDLSDRYNFWSGITGGLFLALSYFGTDQSQVQRYLTGRSVRESRLGLMMNGLLKVPMQFLILLVGVLVFAFYQFYQPPIFFIKAGAETVQQSALAEEWEEVSTAYEDIFQKKKFAIQQYLSALEADQPEVAQTHKEKINQLATTSTKLQQEAKALVRQADPQLETKDTDYVFLSFVMEYFPEGLVGLLLAVILSAAMSSTASELNALATTTTVDLYRRSIRQNQSERHYLAASRWLTLLWGVLAIGFATFASLAENLIEFVNLIGSLFYGTILGIFLVAFYIRWIGARAVFVAAIIAESVVLILYFTADIGFLWFNVIGCGLVVMVASVWQGVVEKNTNA